MKILVINSGSSSLKYQLFNMDNGEVIAKGTCERIGAGGCITHKVPGHENVFEEIDFPNHGAALEKVFSLLTDKTNGVIKSMDEIDAIGHRVAHGGEKFKKSSRVNEEMISYLESIVPINPLHGPGAITGMKACLKLLPNTPQCATFDTSFYSDFEEKRFIYALPYEFYENDHIRRYGFHGTSHRFVSQKAAKLMGKDIKDLKIITCHIGNGSSVTAIENGKAVDTSMGFTPQEGVVMGTRTGSLDPTVIPYIMKIKGYTPSQMEEILNKKSGLLGVSGVSGDHRDCLAAAKNGNKRAELALNIQAESIKKLIGSYTAIMNGLDVLVFTAGIGENAWELRDMVCRHTEYLGIKIDDDKNQHFERGKDVKISADDSRVQVWIIPTNEEYMIALDTQSLIK